MHSPDHSHSNVRAHIYTYTCAHARKRAHTYTLKALSWSLACSHVRSCQATNASTTDRCCSRIATLFIFTLFCFQLCHESSTYIGNVNMPSRSMSL